MPKGSASRRPATKEKTSSQAGKQKRSAPPKYSVDTENESDHESDIASELSESEVDEDVPVRVVAKQQKGKQPAKTTVRHKERERDEAAQVEKSVPVSFLLLSAVKNTGKTRPQYKVHSSFVPSCHMLFTMLQFMHRCVGDNLYVYRMNQSYHVLLSRVYYAIMFWIQTLRAMESANQLPYRLRNFLTAFTDAYPLESLPCAGPLVTYFNTISAHKPGDPKFNKTYVYPTIPNLSDDNRLTRMPNVQALFYLIETMKNAIVDSEFKAPSGTAHAVTTSAFEKGIWKPNAIGLPIYSRNDTVTVFGYRLTATAVTPAPEPPTFVVTFDNTTGVIAANPAVAHELPVSKKTLMDRLDFLRLVPTPDCSIEDDMDVPALLGLDDDMSWFELVVDIANTEAAFFLGSVNFTNIDTISGPAATVATTAEAPTLPTVQKFFNTHFYSTEVKGRSRVADISNDDFDIGTASQLLYKNPSTTFRGLENIEGSRLNNEGSYPPFFDLADRDYEIKSDSAVDAAAGMLSIVRREIFVPKGIETRPPK